MEEKESLKESKKTNKKQKQREILLEARKTREERLSKRSKLPKCQLYQKFETILRLKIFIGMCNLESVTILGAVLVS